MKILVCNDDGINSEGIIALALMLYKKGHDITVVAPNGNRSSYSHHVNFYTNVTVNKADFPVGDGNIKAYALSGTPADCAVYGLRGLDEKFDLVCSGINIGSNLGTEVLYSGTVAACEEGAVLGVPSVAFSYAGHGARTADYRKISEICGKILDKFLPFLGGDFVLNVNIPSEDAAAERYKIVPLGERMYSNEHEWVNDNTYVLTGSPLPAQNPEDSDVVAFESGFISVTPITVDRTHKSALTALKEKL